MKTFKYAMGDVLTAPRNPSDPHDRIEGVVVGRCEYSEQYDPDIPRGETHLYCLRATVNGGYVWNWHPESEVR